MEAVKLLGPSGDFFLGYPPLPPYSESRAKSFRKELGVVSRNDNSPRFQPAREDGAADSRSADNARASLDELAEIRLPSLSTQRNPSTFVPLNSDDRATLPFYRHVKVHTQFGDNVEEIRQSSIPESSPEFRLRSDYLAHTLHVFARKVTEILPEGFSVLIELASANGGSSSDKVHLIHQGATEEGHAILERTYVPFDGRTIGALIPSDMARNTVLKIEERLFYYTTLLAIKKALENIVAARAQSELTEAGDTPAEKQSF